ncbi:MAG: phenylalanine--tRNA ligase subunit beta [Candidatus Nitrosopelagicus sp.]|nr:phenylalanine--tRNA ligase subunit beta [Candidatus Nitrosopelagicus sp.]
MPVVELNLNRIKKLVSGNVTKKKIIDVLPFLGLDIESQDGDEIRIEYSPNRPDYSTDFGIALGLQGLLAVKKGVQKVNIKKTGKYEINVDSSVNKIRPFVTGIVAKNGTIDDQTIKQLMNMQEDLHFGIGRKRKKSSIGLHDLDKILLPLTYTTTTRDKSFIPLNETKEKSISDILSETDVGQNYGWVLGDSKNVPIIIDSEGNTVSFPPIINAALTTVTTKTKNILVEVTSIEKDAAEDMLSVVSSILQMAGFQIFELKISGGKNSTPKLNERNIIYDPKLTSEILGIEMSPSNMVTCLKKCRLDAIIKGKKITCVIPRYRFDIFGPMDLVEEIALGYGIENLEPKLSPSTTIGQKDNVTIKTSVITKTAVGLGLLEVVNSSLTSKKNLYELTKRDSSQMISVLDSKSQEHTILRDSLLSGLLENLSKNIHETYPQKLFETGVIFTKGKPIGESINLAVVMAHKDTNFSEIKAILQSILRTQFKIECKTKSSSESQELFVKGKYADVYVNEKKIGKIGEISNEILDNFRIRTSVVGFEINLSGLIFD